MDQRLTSTPSPESQIDPFNTPPFATPVRSGSSTTSVRGRGTEYRPRRRFKSSRLIGEFEKPWLVNGKKLPDWDRIIFYTCVGIAFAISGYICFQSVASVPKHEYCLIFEDDFSKLDTSVWNHEVQLNGYGTGSFDWTTSDPRNSYVDSQGLHIVPTLTLTDTQITANQLMDGFTLNLTADGTCTAQDQRLSNLTSTSKCAVHSNATSGQIINPVRSARLTTARHKSIRYGRVEVEAKLPAGDWLWPAIWMMPEDSVYGPWPASGEIDIAESRGNDAQKYPLGDNIISSALHWGTSYSNDAYKLSMSEWGSKRTKYSDGFHTFGLEWSENYLFTWLDGRLRQVLFIDFAKNRNLWTYGKFTGTGVNGTSPQDPWSHTGRANTPFDQPFYLILSVAVGSTNGYFPDKVGNKPWADNSETPMRDFWFANSTWLPTWGKTQNRGMIVRSVKMWQQGSCGLRDT